jgi:hypothetical protein
MSLPQFDVQGSLFESLGAIAPDLFADNDKYKLFASLAGTGAVPRATGGVLSSRQRTTWSRAGRVAWGIDLPAFGKGA